MLHITFSDQDIAALRYERYHHPHPRVQMKMEALLSASFILLMQRISCSIGIWASSRKSKDDRRGPTEVETAAAVNEFQKELESPELADIITSDPMLPETVVQEVVQAVTDSVAGRYLERFSAVIAEKF